MPRPAHPARTAALVGAAPDHTDAAHRADGGLPAETSALTCGNPFSSPALRTVAQAAQWLHVSPSTIRPHVREGTLHAFRIAGARSARIPEPELRKLLEPTS